MTGYAAARPLGPRSRGQLRALVGLRWRMVRSPKVRIGLILLACFAAYMIVSAVSAGQIAPRTAFADHIRLLTPTLFLLFAVLAIVTPLTSGGGNELFPPDQLSAYPITPRTVFAASLAVAPLNLAWIVQVIGLCGAAGFAIRPGWTVVFGVLTTLLFVLTATVCGQLVAWAVNGVRQTQRGRIAVWCVLGVVAAALLAAIRLNHTLALLDRVPTTRVVVAVLASGQGQLDHTWVDVVIALGLLTVLAYALGVALCSWALRRPGDAGAFRESKLVRRRAPRRSAYLELVAIDRASVWRSAPLRRGLLVLGVLPGLVAAVAGVEWSSIIILPALVAAGAGLLFGVNAFCLDGSGAVWLATLPHPPRWAIWAKIQVLLETLLLPMAVTVLAAGLRSPRPPTATEALAVLASAVACAGLVTASCLHLSLNRPHRAELRGSRDTPAPPGTMAVYSARLASITTPVAMVLSGLAYSGLWWIPVLTAVPLVSLAGMRLLRTAARWNDPDLRARVVATVASG